MAKLILLVAFVVGLIICVQGAIFKRQANGKQSFKLKPELEDRFKPHDGEEHERQKRQIALPIRFDASEKWPQCASVFELQVDQGPCLGANAVIPFTSMISDRRCIATGATTPISAWDVLTCSGNTNVCSSISDQAALNMYIGDGITTGGAYRGTGCKPYGLSPTASTYTSTDFSCKQQCQPSYTDTVCGTDKRKGSSILSIAASDVAVMQEIYTNGSVVAQLKVSQNFYQYESGVFAQGIAATKINIYVKLVGWGYDAEENYNYWLALSSFGTRWGEKGYVRIIKGNPNLDAEISKNVKAVVVGSD